MITAEIVAVKPASETFPLAFPTELDAIEADARDMGDELTDAEWDAMADAAAERDLCESGRLWM